jgi:DNA-binding winged helix-turn-helix (wHTH) protein
MLLIISKNKKNARSISDTFHYMSILSYVATPHEALSEISNLYRAVLIFNPEGLADVKDYVKRIKSYKSDLPIFALTPYEAPIYYHDIFEKCFPMSTFTPALANEIIDYANKNNKAKVGDYFLAGFDASNYNLGVNYFYDKIHFTKTEAMILRFLIRIYPIPVSCKDIVKYAFRSSRSPDPASIRTHISLMNKRFEATIGRRMITFVPRKGYRIITPEFDEIQAETVK